MTDFSASINVAATNTDMNVPHERKITQVELEEQMAAFGKARAERMMSRNEEAGSADNNPYAKALYNRYILPLAAMIREDISTKKTGRNQAHVTLLEPLDPEAVAFIAVRGVLNGLMLGGRDIAVGYKERGGRDLMTSVGRSVYGELLLSMFSEASPDLFYTLMNDLGRRMSKSERHRLTVFRLQAQQNGVPVPEWGASGTSQVGGYLIDRLSILGMVDVTNVRSSVVKGRIRNTIDVTLSDTAFELIGNIKGMVAETTPYFLPCVEQPKDWVSIMDGGFHTNAMRRLQPFCIKSKFSWSEVAEYDLSKVLTAINRLQRVHWQVNADMLDTIKKVAKHFDMDEIVAQAECPSPQRPDWLSGDVKAETMTPEELEEFGAWKRAKRQWYTEMKLRGTRYGRFVNAITVADKFRSFDQIYFVYFADFRGRLYAQTTGINPQGSDLQKSLIRFATGKPLDTSGAQRWFCINGANKWGYDKDTLEGRVKWIEVRHDNIMAFAEDPISNRGWQEADCPLQFLAWCLEYREWKTAPDTFVSHLPVGMDGSCNGLQNFSAMLRDEVGGKATNLVPAPLPNDIYHRVADVTLQKLKAAAARLIPDADPDDAESVIAQKKAMAYNKYLGLWLKHGTNRSLVKRSVMTLPYGSTRFSCAEFIAEDYLKEGKAPEFSKEEYNAAAQFLSHFVWDSIGEVVVKAKLAMDWLQSAVKPILAEHEDIIWVGPDGFPVIQTYQETSFHRINTKLQGNTKIRVALDTDTPCARRHRNGIAPNFIHNHDGAHMKLVIIDADGMDLAMIHDDYGTHAADADRLYQVIRTVFVRMYEDHDPLADFATRYGLPSPPEKGNLDLRLVLKSPYFFS